MSYFNDIISENEYFMDLPDCIAEGIDYKGKIEQAFGLTDGMLNLGIFACERREGHFE